MKYKTVLRELAWFVLTTSEFNDDGDWALYMTEKQFKEIRKLYRALVTKKELKALAIRPKL